ncbi:MAG: Hint domain-containing protein [Myxococcales bacterium]|nr:Hint domain-containing protein [Myxococcales bacterium]
MKLQSSCRYAWLLSTLTIWAIAPTLAQARPTAKTTPKNDPTLLYRFFEGCWGSRDRDLSGARRKCRRLRKHGQRYERTNCKCRAKYLITVRSTDPVAYYFSRENMAIIGRTSNEVRDKCEKEKRRLGRSGVVDGSVCSKIGVAYGPYRRHHTVSEYDDHKRFVYLDHREGNWLDKTGEGPCFVAGTRITTPGGARRIETLRVGDRVLAWNARTRERVWAAVTGMKVTPNQPVGDVVLSDGTRLSPTGNHPVYVLLRGWLPARRLRPGMFLVHQSGRRVLVRSVSWSRRRATVYNISVAGPESYFAEGILVHNY